jgi:hypothetical protein
MPVWPASGSTSSNDIDSMNNTELTDDDREEILRLVLAEADNVDVANDLARFPAEARGLFRKVVIEAGLVTGADLSTGSDGEQRFTGRPTLTPRGRRRLSELNEKRRS